MCLRCEKKFKRKERKQKKREQRKGRFASKDAETLPPPDRPVPTATTFQVAPVETKNHQPTKTNLKDVAISIARFWKDSTDDETGLAFETGQVNFDDIVENGLENAFIGTLMMAYNHHIPLILSPDDIWLLISLSVSKFLGNKENAEKYRKVFVEHDGQLDLQVDGNKFGITWKSPEMNKERWPLFVQEIRHLIAQNTKANIAEVMTKSFSTTGSVEATAFEISLMESMQHYFRYGCVLICGIPEITLEGERQDYVSIIERIDKLAELVPDLENYLTGVKPHVGEMVKCFDDNPNAEWWRQMIIENWESDGGSGGGEHRVLTGWILDFFLNREEIDANPSVTFTPVNFLARNTNHEMKFVGGFVATAQVHDDKGKKAVRPAIGWLTYYWK